jgi:uncharacterized membrane protein
MEEQRKIDLRHPLSIDLALLAAMIVASAYAWMHLPDHARIPIHWGIDGHVDGYGNKLIAFSLLPVLNFFIAAIFISLPRIEPRKQSIERSWGVISTLWIALEAVLFVAHLCIVYVALGGPESVVPLAIPAALGVLLIVMGNGFGKLGRNRYVGIRTPWTLESDLSWGKTHRLGGWLFVLLGLVVCISVTSSNSTLVLICLIGGLFLITVATTLYSYIVWRSDPHMK